MTSTNVTIRLDKEVKSEAEALFSALGLSMSTAFNIFVRQAIRQGKIPFEISAVPNAETRQVLDDVLAHRGLTKPVNTVSALMEELNAQD